MTSYSGTNTNKDVIYIDVDDEITALIDKVRGSEKKIVALVLPKRATVLQSIVNMKLLKRAADHSKKSVVLITAEAGLLPLAGSVGIHVAKSLNTKPEVPDGPERVDDKPETVEEVSVDDEPVDESKSVGELSGDPVAANEPEETIELDDEDDEANDKQTDDPKPHLAKNRRLKIPNFNKFRLLLVLSVFGVIALGGVGYAAFVVMPKAKILIKTDSTAVSIGTALQLKTTADAVLDVEGGIVPAQVQEVKKTLTQQVPATGSVNNGEKATGSVTIKNCTNSSITIPAGTGVSTSGLTYTTDSTISLSDGNFTIGGVCKSSGSHVATVDVTAQQGGTKYNIGSGASFSVAGHSSGVSGTGSAMSGGTDDIVKVVTQGDIDGAKQKITSQDTAPIQQELKMALIGRSLYAIEATFGIGTPETKTDVAVNAAAENVTVTQTITYTMLGVKEGDLEQIAKAQASKKIDTKKQSIIDFGLDKAVFSLQSVNPDGATVDIQTTVVAGAELNINAIKKQVAGKKAGDAKELIMANPGVTDVTVQYSPFWVNSIPKDTAKITVTVQEPQIKQDAKTEP